MQHKRAARRPGSVVATLGIIAAVGCADGGDDARSVEPARRSRGAARPQRNAEPRSDHVDGESDGGGAVTSGSAAVTSTVLADISAGQDMGCRDISKAMYDLMPA